MFFGKRITPSTARCSAQTARLKAALQSADAVLVGAGAGLSVSAGFAYDGERFRRYFSDFEARYGFHDMYSGGFYPFPTPEESWAYWSRFIFLNRYSDPPRPVYSELLELVEDQGLLCPHHQCGPLLSKGRICQESPFLHPGGLRPVAML